MVVFRSIILIYRRDVARQKAVDMGGIRLWGAGRRDFVGSAVPIAVFGRHVCGVARDVGQRVLRVDRGCRTEIGGADRDAIRVAARRFLGRGNSFAVI